MKSQVYGRKDNDDTITVTVPDHIELPARVEVRDTSDDAHWRTVEFWWHYAPDKKTDWLEKHGRYV
jgi:hypothetical protein